jgi:L-amino acid N-acyltransferase YncA
LNVLFVASRQGAIRSDELKAMIEEAQKQMVKTKERLDADREKQEAALHKKLSERKKQRMQEQAKMHKKELDEFTKQKDAETGLS